MRQWRHGTRRFGARAMRALAMFSRTIIINTHSTNRCSQGSRPGAGGGQVQHESQSNNQRAGAFAVHPVRADGRMTGSQGKTLLAGHILIIQTILSNIFMRYPVVSALYRAQWCATAEQARLAQKWCIHIISTEFANSPGQWNRLCVECSFYSYTCTSRSGQRSTIIYSK